MPRYFISGTSRGIGAKFVEKLLDDPANRVAAAARNPHGSPALQSLSTTYGDDRLLLVKMDTTGGESIQAAAEFVRDKWGSIDVLINNAGIMGDSEPCSILDESLEQIEAVFKTNVLGVLATTKAFYPLLLKSTVERKLIINTASGLASIALHLSGAAKLEIDPRLTNMGGYVMSKAALNMQTAVLANRTKVDGIIVVSLAPGLVDTDMSAQILPSSFPPEFRPISTEESVAAQLKVIGGLSAKDNGKYISNDGSILAF